MKIITRFTFLAMLPLLWACDSTDPIVDPPSIDPDEVVLNCNDNYDACELAQTNNNFGLDIFRNLHQQTPNENIFISPTSLATALTMTLNGAANETFTDMQNAMEVEDWDMPTLNAAYQELLPALPNLDNQVDLAIANAIFHEQTFPFESEFLNLNAEFFFSEVNGLDFRDEASVGIINGWVDTKTNGLIPDIIDAIPGTAVMYLINAIYFKANWRFRFDSNRTTKQNFYLADNTTEEVDMMTFGEEVSVPYLNHPMFQAIDLAYADSVYSMMLLLPKEESSLQEVVQELNEENWQQWTDALSNEDLEVYMPKFTLEDKHEESMKKALEDLGMGIAFEEIRADFTKMGPLGLYISRVIHKSFIEVNEAGTEAAAVTAVEISNESASYPGVLRFDRPFVFAIRDNQTNNILFVGQYVKP
jgi:serpin B